MPIKTHTHTQKKKVENLPNPILVKHIPIKQFPNLDLASIPTYLRLRLRLAYYNIIPLPPEISETYCIYF